MIYRRFSVGTPHTSPVFTEGAAILPRIPEDTADSEGDTHLRNDFAELEGSPSQNPGLGGDLAGTYTAELATHQNVNEELWQSYATTDSAAKWRQSVLRLLETTCRWTGTEIPALPF